MSYLPPPLARLVDQLTHLPGIGAKTAQRLAFFLLQAPRTEAEQLAQAILAAKDQIHSCSRCFNLTEIDPCRICQEAGRDQGLLCVVEDARDVVALERTHEYHGLYHVLQGVISPLEGVGPEQLRVRELLARLEKEQFREVILATNSTLEGEATAMYLAKLLKPSGVTVTRIAYGMPVGGDLEYVDAVTLVRALEGRRAL